MAEKSSSGGGSSGGGALGEECRVRGVDVVRSEAKGRILRILHRHHRHRIGSAGPPPLTLSGAFERKPLHLQLPIHGPSEAFVIFPVPLATDKAHHGVQDETDQDQGSADGQDDGDAQDGKGGVAGYTPDLLTAAEVWVTRPEGRVAVENGRTAGIVDHVLLKPGHGD